MALKTVIASLVLGSLLFSTTALADDNKSVKDWATQEANRRQGGNDYRDDRRDDDRRDRRGGGVIQVHVHGDSCHHGPAPLPPPRARGRYELQTVSRYVEGGVERVWVPEVCKERYRRNARITKCTGGYYEERRVPGRYEQVQEWVWVPHSHDDGWRSRRTHAATYHP